MEREKKDFDYLIVGQGLAGTLLGYFLIKSGKRILYMDNSHHSAASKIAAGIMNPITGRKFVKTWRVGDLFPFARELYAEMEKETGVRFFYDMNIIRELFNFREDNEWLLRTDFPGYDEYYEGKPDLGNYKGKVKRGFSTIELKQSGRMNIPLLVGTFSEKWKKEKRILTEKFIHKNIFFDKRNIRYGEYKFKKIIFCEGYQAKNNPFFQDLNYEESKGERLIVRIPNMDFRKIFKHKLYIVPLGNDEYWIGATNDWYHEDDLPTEEKYKILKNGLENILNVPFEILHHGAAIRPTNRDRKPLLGLHPEHHQLAIFNGLGSKGASLGPYWANQMADFLINEKPLEKEVNIRRIYDKKK